MTNRKIYVISDTHFGHENVLRFKDDDGAYIRSGFSGIRDHDEHIIEKWNDVVREHDIVYHLGDVYFASEGYAKSILNRLNGRKRLIVGNHDKVKSKVLYDSFQKISMWRMFPKLKVVLTHVPIFIDGKAKYTRNIHGHIHQKESPTAKHINASCEAINYTPIDIEELLNETSR